MARVLECAHLDDLDRRSAVKIISIRQFRRQESLKRRPLKQVPARHFERPGYGFLDQSLIDQPQSRYRA